MLLVNTIVLVTLCVAAIADELLLQKFALGVVSDTYGSFTSSLDLRAVANLDGVFHGTSMLSPDGTPGFFEVIRYQIEATGNPLKGAVTLNFLHEDSASNVTFDFAMKRPNNGGNYLEASGPYATNSFTYGVYWWRFHTSNEFTLQLIDHVFSNTTTIHGFAAPTQSSTKPWYQTWALVLVTGGVFLIKLWLGNMEARRAAKREAMSKKQK